MSMSAFFRALRSSYQAEIDDLATDSEGRDVLRQRLLEKRGQIAFLSQMMETAPEMVAVAFHGGFHFELPAVMDQILTLESDEFPDWDSLSDAVQLTPWARDLAKTLLKEPQGAWFMTVAAALEYLYFRPSPHHQEAGHHHDNAHQDDHAPHANTRHHDHGHDFDADDERVRRNDQDHEEDSADWLEGQGFDRKD
jgi:ABC-type nickel/cobalt efflux system permease component RcnA